MVEQKKLKSLSKMLSEIKGDIKRSAITKENLKEMKDIQKNAIYLNKTAVDFVRSASVAVK